MLFRIFIRVCMLYMHMGVCARGDQRQPQERHLTLSEARSLTGL